MRHLEYVVTLLLTVSSRGKSSLTWSLFGRAKCSPNRGIAAFSTSSIFSVKIKLRFFGHRLGSSVRSFSFSRGRITQLIPTRRKDFLFAYLRPGCQKASLRL